MKYFKQNNASLFALIECVFVTQENCPMLAELIVSSGTRGMHVFLEEVSLPAAGLILRFEQSPAATKIE